MSAIGLEMEMVVVPQDGALTGSLVAEAERRGGGRFLIVQINRRDGEIVTVVSEASDAYHDVALHYAVAAMLAVTAVGAMWPHLLASDGGWGGGDRGRELLLQLIAQAVAFLLVRFALAWRPLRLLRNSPHPRLFAA